MSLPHERVFQSVVEECASQWYRLGTELGYKDNQIRAITCDIPTLDGKLQAIIGRKSLELGKGKVVEALLGACDKILPLATVAVMEDLGIKYISTGKALLFVCILNGTLQQCSMCVVFCIVSDRLLYELGKEVGRDWKILAKCLGLASRDVDNIKMKAKSSRKRAWKMLQLWHAKLRGEFRVQEIHRTLEQIRKWKQTKQQTKRKLLSSLV